MSEEDSSRIKAVLCFISFQFSITILVLNENLEIPIEHSFALETLSSISECYFKETLVHKTPY